MIGTGGSGPGQFTLPSAIAVDDSGNIYVLDHGNARVQKLSPNGTPVGQWQADEWAAERQLRNAWPQIAVDRAGLVYVSDPGFDRVFRIPPGAFVAPGEPRRVPSGSSSGTMATSPGLPQCSGAPAAAPGPTAAVTAVPTKASAQSVAPTPTTPGGLSAKPVNPASGANLGKSVVLNGSFEEAGDGLLGPATVPQGWTRITGGRSEEVWVAKAGHSGGHYVAVHGPTLSTDGQSNYFVGWSTQVRAEPLARYRLEFWVKEERPAGVPSGVVKVTIHQGLSMDTVLSVDQLTNEWSRYAVDVQVPQGMSTADLDLNYLSPDPQGRTEVAFDDVSLSPIQ